MSANVHAIKEAHCYCATLSFSWEHNNIYMGFCTHTHHAWQWLHCYKAQMNGGEYLRTYPNSSCSTNRDRLFTDSAPYTHMHTLTHTRTHTLVFKQSALRQVMGATQGNSKWREESPFYYNFMLSLSFWFTHQERESHVVLSSNPHGHVNVAESVTW